ncbi:MAG TPA: hypothetical protein VMI94_21530 [Bryobacteraceae bacterium]|nr:hypothetical protein [Bryobacteraceae bacterium]
MRHPSVCAALMLPWLLAPPAGRGASLPWDIVFTEIPNIRVSVTTAGGLLRAPYGDGGRLVLLQRDGSHQVLTPDFASAADPAVSFDGKHILFAGQKSPDTRWNIYEMNADGSGARQITHDLGDCRAPIYQPPIFYLDDPGPMPQIAFVSNAPGVAPEYGPGPATAIYSARLDGSGVRRLTYNPSGAFDPVMLPDGRMLFSAWERDEISHGLLGRIELQATNIDGTDYATFSGGQGGPVKQMACVTTGRLVVFVDADTVAWDGAGRLAAIDLRRNLHSYWRLALPANYLYHSPSALPDGAVLVSRRPADGSGTFDIFRLDPRTGQAELVFASRGLHDIQAQALAARPVPDGRSSVVDDKQPWAKLYCLNINDSDLDPESWRPGLVKRIRLLEGLSRSGAGAACARRETLSPLLQKRFLGEIDVDADGSFHLQLPASLPVQIQALDENGMALRSSAWIWAKNKEQRGCIGCHEDGERTPENAMAHALTHPAAMLMLPPERRRIVDFERDIAPILQQKCATAACHSGTVQPTLTGAGERFSKAYEELLRKDPQFDTFRYVTPGTARTSPLVWALLGRNTSEPWDHPWRGVRPKTMPPAGAAPLTANEKRAIFEWIDLGAHYQGLPGMGGNR